MTQPYLSPIDPTRLLEVLGASHRKIKAALEFAASGQHQSYPSGILELGVALDGLQMMVNDVAALVTITSVSVSSSVSTRPLASSFQEELTALLNKHSLGGGSSTPAFILAEYLIACLQMFDKATRQRRAWWSDSAGLDIEI